FVSGNLWCSEGVPTPAFQSYCTSPPVNGVYSEGEFCDGFAGICGTTSAVGDCCQTTVDCLDSHVASLQHCGLSPLLGTNLPGYKCDGNSGVCHEPAEQIAPCDGPGCGACGGTCSGFGGGCAVAGGGFCGHTGSVNNVCYDNLTCTAPAGAACRHDFDWPPGEGCVGGHSCCARCPT